MFADPEVEYYSDGKLSRSGSTGSRASIGGIRKRSAPRTRKSFQLARPPPSFGHKQRLNLRPKLLLQLQHLPPSGRPIPTLDVLPSTFFATKLAANLPRVFFRRRDGLCLHDMVVVSSESYDAPMDKNLADEDGSGDDGWSSRDVI